MIGNMVVSSSIPIGAVRSPRNQPRDTGRAYHDRKTSWASISFQHKSCSHKVRHQTRLALEKFRVSWRPRRAHSRPTPEDGSNFALSIGKTQDFRIVSGNGVYVDIHLVEPSSLGVVVFDLGNLMVKVIHCHGSNAESNAAEFAAGTGGYRRLV